MGSSAVGRTILFAQTVTVRVIDARNRRPLGKQQVEVTFSYTKSRGDIVHLAGETNENGEAHFMVPEPRPTRIWVTVNIKSESWVRGRIVFGDMQSVIQKGVLGTQSGKPAASAKTVPGEILIFARPTPFLERLLYPVLRLLLGPLERG